MRNLAEVYDGSAYKQTQGAFVGRSCNRIGFGQGFLSLARGDRSQRPDLRLLWRVGRSLETHGFQVKVIETTELNRVKARLGVPFDLQACHTAQVAGYLIEGHVPAAALEKFLRQKPDALGLSVPGMPSGSPGMTGEYEEYDVILFGKKDERHIFGRYKGETQI